MKASPQLCICETCLVYGSCSLFEDPDLEVQQLNRTCLRSGKIGTENLGIDFNDIAEEKQEEVAAEMLVRDTVVAIAADPKSRESYHKDCRRGEREGRDVEDGFGQVIKKGIEHLECVFLERKFNSDNLCTIPTKPKSAFLFRENVTFPSVQLESKKGHFELTNKELLMIIKYMELSNQTSIF